MSAGNKQFCGQMIYVILAFDDWPAGR